MSLMPSSSPADAAASPSASPLPAANLSPTLVPRAPVLLAAEWRGLPEVPWNAATVQAVSTGLTLVATLVQRHQGRIVQVTGRTVLVAFGLEADEAQAEQVEHAVVCAVALQMALREWQLQHPAAEGAGLYLGLGLCAGPVMAGCLPGGEASGVVALLGAPVRRVKRLATFSLRGQVLIEEALYQRCWGLVSATAPVDVIFAPGEASHTLRELVAIPSRKLKVPRREFRRSHRVTVHLPCTCQQVLHGTVLPARFQATVRNLSYHGVHLDLPSDWVSPGTPLALHGELRLNFTLPYEIEPATDIAARVVFVQDDGSVGLEFIDPPPVFQAQVQRCVLQHLALR